MNTKIMISFSKKNIDINGGKKYSLDNGKYLIVFSSPNHITKEYNEIETYSDISKYCKLFRNDSFLFVDEQKKKFYFYRDWPGNIQTFYYYNFEDKQFAISDNISFLAKQQKGIKISRSGIKLFLNKRKHYHSHTIYDKIEMLHPGLMIEFEQSSFKFNIKAWYSPYSRVTIKNKVVASQKYLEALDSALNQSISREQPIALMFSGGSDSTLLLERLVKLGYKNIYLFSICIKGNTLQLDYAMEKAKFYNLTVEPIFVEKDETIKNWTKLYEYTYHYLSDLRIDGIFSPSIQVYSHLKNYFKNIPVSIVWGSQYALISPVISAKAIMMLSFLSMIKRSSFSLPFIKKTIEKLFLLVLKNTPVLDHRQVSTATLHAYRKLYLKAFAEHENVTELIDLLLSTNYNYCKHWWMDWRGKIKDVYFPIAKNIYPFHDRTFQETSMSISLSVRIGGLKNVFTMPKEYKSFFYSTLPKNIPLSSVKRGNYTTLPEFLSLFKNELFYNNLLKYLKSPDNKKLVAWVLNELNMTIPDSYDAFLKLNTLEVEKLSGIIFLIIRFRTDNVEF